MNNKKMYLFKDIDDDHNFLLLLSDEQAEVFYWLIESCEYQFTFELLETHPPLEIIPKAKNTKK